MGVKEMYLQFVKEGVPPKEAAKLVQSKTGLSARTGLPLKQNKGSVEIYNAQNQKKGYLGQYGG
jgi:hypothetical protein